MTQEAEDQREQMLAGWARVSGGWRQHADRLRDFGMPVSLWMIEQAALQPGERVLELAAGPGDTGFMAAELIRPGGTLICSDASEEMLAIAHDRAAAQGVTDIEFKRLDLEWIDLETASVDAILCRFGIMLSSDVGAALRECRRVLRPGGRLSAAVWDVPDRNPWMRIPGGVMVELGHSPPPDPTAPGPFSLSAPGLLAESAADGGFVDVTVEPIPVSRHFDSLDVWLGETVDLSMAFSEAWPRLDDDQRSAVRRQLVSRSTEFAGADGSLDVPGSVLGVIAHA